MSTTATTIPARYVVTIGDMLLGWGDTEAAAWAAAAPYMDETSPDAVLTDLGDGGWVREDGPASAPWSWGA